MAEEKTKKKEKEKIKKAVPERKKAALAKLADTLIKSPTIMIVSIEGMPSFNFQQIKQALKKQLKITVVKKSLMLRALEKAKKEKPEITALEKWLERHFAIISSELEPFELASLLADYKLPGKAKAGQVSPKDIAIDPGLTDLPAGPAISELSAVGLKVSIEAGKIAIKEGKVLVHKDEAIPANVAAVLTKLEIVPFQISLEPLIAYDSKKNKIYKEIKIDKEALTEQLKEFFTQATALSMHINYPTSETITLLITKANQELNALSNLIK